MKKEMKEELIEIVNAPELDEEWLEEWIGEWLEQNAREEWEALIADDYKAAQERIAELKPLVKEYNGPNCLVKMDGSLFGVGFAYDEDRDDRILIAIDNLASLMKNKITDVIAVTEHEGVLTIWGKKGIEKKLRKKLDGDFLSVAGDEWYMEIIGTRIQ